ncbi:hypothetical protein [uncultured Paracoccus sp.]|uniref:hypothetical protein n=1 Tax=uncultured Paracoccus sp. TaxID=189685 RepID=UPI00261763A4|nr:hypothetical protein [uncultured Paracoccus sp.]
MAQAYTGRGFAGERQHEKRRDEARQQLGGAGAGDQKRHVALGKISHHVAERVAGSAAAQYNARSDFRRHQDKVGQHHRDQQHGEERRQHPEPDITRAPGNLLKVTARDGQPYTDYDDDQKRHDPGRQLLEV